MLTSERIPGCPEDFPGAHSDGEPITPDTLPVLEGALRDIAAVGDDVEWLGAVYAARCRNRPLSEGRMAQMPEGIRALLATA